MDASGIVQTALWSAVLAFALMRGRGPVCVVAAALLLELGISLASWRFSDPYALQPLLLLGDALVLAACGWAAVRTRTAWATGATACQALSLMTQLTKAVDPTVISWGYLTLAVLWGYGVLACLLAAVLLQGGSRPRHGR